MEITTVTVVSKHAIAIRDHSTAAGLSDKYGELFGELGTVMKKQGLKMDGHPYGLYHKFTPEDVDMEAGFPISGDAKPEGRMNLTDTYSGKAVCGKFYGPYTKLAEGWNEMMEYVKQNNLEVIAPCFEIYITGQSEEPDSSKWLTEIYLPIK